MTCVFDLSAFFVVGVSVGGSGRFVTSSRDLWRRGRDEVGVTPASSCSLPQAPSVLCRSPTMLYKALLLLAMCLLPQTSAFMLTPPQGAIACRTPAAAIESTLTLCTALTGCCCSLSVSASAGSAALFRAICPGSSDPSIVA